MNLSLPRSVFWTVLAGLAGVVILSGAAALLLRSGLAYPCPFKFLIGLPCPTCGATRSLAALSELNIVESIRFNPLFVVGGSLALAGFILQGRFTTLRRFGWPLFFSGLLLNWVYLLLFLPR